MAVPDAIADTCRRCGASLDGRRYCGECGQRRAQPLTYRRVLGEAWAQVAQLDTAFLRTLISLTRSPGSVALAYVNGDRASWTNPFLYFLTMATVFASVVITIDAHAPILWVGVTREQGIQIVSAWAYLVLPGQVPIAWLQAKIFSREGRTPAECFVFQTYLGAQGLLYMALYCLLIAAEKLSGVEALDGPRPLAMAIVAAFLSVMVVTLMASLGRFYAKPGLAVVPKGIVMMLSGGLMFVLCLKLLFLLHGIF